MRFNPAIAEALGDTCPPKEAQPANLTIYRGVRTPPVGPDDFLSHVEAQVDGNNPNDCEHWGLSVWVSMEAVEHARRTYRGIRRWYVAQGDVTEEDGVLLVTPSSRQPEHHTFWKVFGKDISGAFQIVLNPANAA